LIFVTDLPAVFVALLSSMALDYVVRQKLGGTNMTYNYIEQVAAPTPESFLRPASWCRESTLRNWIEIRVLELSYTAWDMMPLARDLGDTGPPFIWDQQRRAHLRAELDGAFFHVYGINRDDAEYILTTFPIVNRRDPELVKRALEAYDRIANASNIGEPFISALDPPAGDGPRHVVRS
jgi:hypothetical protein